MDIIGKIAKGIFFVGLAFWLIKLLRLIGLRTIVIVCGFFLVLSMILPDSMLNASGHRPITPNLQPAYDRCVANSDFAGPAGAASNIARYCTCLVTEYDRDRRGLTSGRRQSETQSCYMDYIQYYH